MAKAKACKACKPHYGDGGQCDEGKPVASPHRVDVTVSGGGGTIALVQPLTKVAEEWLVENVDPEANWFGTSLPVEPRYLEALVVGLQAAGFRVGRGGGIL